MKIKNKLQGIIQAWKNVIISDKEFEEFYKNRMDICSDCEHNKLNICSLCGCPLVAKTKSRMVYDDGTIEQCDAGKWLDTPIIIDDKEYIIKSDLPENLQEYFTEVEFIPYEKWIEFLKSIDK